MAGNGLAEGQAEHRQYPSVPVGTPGEVSAGVVCLAESLAREFSAPLGILDPNLSLWRTIVGASAQHFPGVDDRLLDVATSTGIRLGRVALWRRGHGAGRVWLVL